VKKECTDKGYIVEREREREREREKDEAENAPIARLNVSRAKYILLIKLSDR